MTAFANRIEAVQQTLAKHDKDALIVGPSRDLFYLIGYDALPLERLTLLIIPRTGMPTLVVPELEQERAEAFNASVYATVATYTETDDPIARVAAVLDGAAAITVQQHLFSRFTLALQHALPHATFTDATSMLAPLRLIKTVDELHRLQAVGRAIDTVHGHVSQWLKPGVTEHEAGRQIANAILDTHDAVNFVIVASGPNGASPHHELSDRKLCVGDAIVVDIGGTLNGYCSDETRNYVIGEPPAQYQEVHDTVLAAHAAAVAAVAPGVSANDVDAAARQVITEAGFGPYFIHRTGHGIGLEAHEEPWIVAGNDTILQSGMTFSIEPGIYLPGRFGVRIEDIVAVIDSGVELFNTTPRHFVTV